MASTFTDVVSTNVSFASFTEASSSPSFAFALAVSSVIALDSVLSAVAALVDSFSRFVLMLVSSFSALVVSATNAALSSPSFSFALAISFVRSLLTVSEDVPRSVTFLSIADMLFVSSVSFAVDLATSAFTSLSNWAIEALFALIRFVCSPSFAIDLSISASSLEETSFICLLETYKAPLSLTIILSS